ncbi:MAG: DUF5666 domain-containing protein [Terriglobales bacterium]
MNTKYRAQLRTEIRNVTLSIIATIAILALSINAFAHGDQQHVMGTVTQIDATSITVKTTTGEVKTVMILADTKFAKGASTITQHDVKVGDRVVIHAKPQGNMLHATEVRIGGSAKPVPQPQ